MFKECALSCPVGAVEWLQAHKKSPPPRSPSRSCSDSDSTQCSQTLGRLPDWRAVLARRIIGGAAKHPGVCCPLRTA